jgi:hypothetical protein
LGDEPDPRDVMHPFPADLMRMWPISTRVNKPENDEPSIIEPIELASETEVEGLTGASYGEKRPERLAQRNGYRDYSNRRK